MRASTVLATISALALGGATASPTGNNTPRQNDPTLVIFKVYRDVSTCGVGQTPDQYDGMFFGYRSQALSGECFKFEHEGGWDGAKAVQHTATDFNTTAYAYTTDNCVDDGNKAALFDSVCQSRSTNFLSWKFERW